MPNSHKPPAGPVSREEIRNRLRDAEKGIAPGVDFGSVPGQEAPIPDITDLGLPLSVRKKLEALCADQAELGKIERDASKQRTAVNTHIKMLLAEHVPEHIPSFQCGVCRVTRFIQNRTSLSKDILQSALLRLGVQPKIITKAVEEATTVNPVFTLKITAGEE